MRCLKLSGGEKVRTCRLMEDVRIEKQTRTPNKSSAILYKGNLHSVQTFFTRHMR